MVIKSHILIMEVRSCRLWGMNLCRQTREQNRVFVIFQNLHFQYSTKIVLKDVLQCPVMYTGFWRCFVLWNYAARYRTFSYLRSNSASWILLWFTVDSFHYSAEIPYFWEKSLCWALLMPWLHISQKGH